MFLLLSIYSRPFMTGQPSEKSKRVLLFVVDVADVCRRYYLKRYRALRKRYDEL